MLQLTNLKICQKKKKKKILNMFIFVIQSYRPFKSWTILYRVLFSLTTLWYPRAAVDISCTWVPEPKQNTNTNDFHWNFIIRLEKGLRYEQILGDQTEDANMQNGLLLTIHIHQLIIYSCSELEQLYFENYNFL